MAELLAKLQEAKEASVLAESKGTSSIGEKVQLVKGKEIQFTYGFKDVILYALGVGVTVQGDSHLKFLYEGHEDFSTLPTFGVIVAQVIYTTG